MRKVEESDETNTTSCSKYPQYGSNSIAGKIVVVTGFTDGIDSNGDTNHTLEVAYRLAGLGNLNCGDIKCFHAELKDNGDEGNHIILEILSSLPGNMDEAGITEGVEYTNIGKLITHFFDKAVTLNRYDGKILACSTFTFTEVKSEAP